MADKKKDEGSEKGAKGGKPPGGAPPEKETKVSKAERAAKSKGTVSGDGMTTKIDLRLQASTDNLSATAGVLLSEGSDPHVVLSLSAAPATLTAADPLAPPSALASDDTAAETAQLRGVIHDERGRGLSGAVIEVQGDPTTRASALSNARGEFQLRSEERRGGK